MAYYAALVSLVQLLDDIILQHHYPSFLLGKDPLVKSLHQKFISLEESLQDYSSNGDKVNDRLEGRIRDVAYRVEDIIEIEISNKIRLQESTSINPTCSEETMNIMKKKSSPMSCFGFGCFRGKESNKECSIVEELHMVEQETDFIMEEMMAIKERQQKNEETSTKFIKFFVPKFFPKLNWDSPTTSATVQTPAAQTMMVGFDEDLIIIKEQLCSQRSQLQVIPIVGMGGIGKTTLARNTFDDACIEYHFDFRVWVTVSQNYHEDKVLQIIFESLKLLVKELPGGEGGELKERIYKCLKGRRYLIVVDDIWSTQVWEDVKMIFPDDSSGSRILLTTRLLDVARYASPSGFLHEVQLLNKEKSWNLLRKKVFPEECCPPELEDIGMLIASKCCGLPLAIVVIAGILSNFRTLHHWENIAGKVSTILSTSDEQMNRILSLSYNHLPHQLKACFLYLGRFPEDYEINIPNLVRLWIADGLLKSNDTSKFAEKVGEECLEDLVKRNLVLINGKRSNGQFKSCILHDLVREFCRQRAFSEFFFHEEDREGHLYPVQSEKTRRINYYTILRRGECRQCNIGKLVRSVSFYTGSGAIDFTREFASHDVKLLRVLSCSGAYISYFSADIPDAIFQLLYLKYLSFNMTTCINDGILSSMFKLQNLQTLNFKALEIQRIILPPRVWEMMQLRHLIISEMILPSIPRVGGRIPIQKLECLQTLMTVVDCGFSSDVIQMIPNLTKLKVKGRESGIKNLVHLPHLEELTITECIVTSNFSFHSNLKKLSLTDCDIPWNDMTMVGSLPNLQVLKLGPGSFVGEEWEPVEGEFARLKFLKFHHSGLKYWRAECNHFPCLEYLRIRHCDNLEMIPSEIGDIPTLEVIEVFGSQAAANSAMQLQVEQRDMGNDALHVRIYDRHTHAGERFQL